MTARPTKLQAYTQLAADNSAIVTSNYENWTAFLATASRFYKYTFLEQLMIHTQRPQATACAEYDLWSRHMRRYVRRNAKGIAVIRFVDGQPTLRYVFDVADTGPRQNALYPFLWENREEYQGIIPAALEQRFQVPGDGQGLPVQLATIAARLAQNFWANGREQIIGHIKDCLLDDPATAFQDAVSASVTYALLSRCGLHPERFFDADDFSSVYRLNTFRSVLALGTAVSKIDEAVLRCVEAAIKRYERDKRSNGPAPIPAATPAAPPGAKQETPTEEPPEVPDVWTSGAPAVPAKDGDDDQGAPSQPPKKEPVRRQRKSAGRSKHQDEVDAEVRRQAVRLYPRCAALFELPLMVYAQIKEDNATRQRPYRVSEKRIKDIIGTMPEFNK